MDICFEWLSWVSAHSREDWSLTVWSAPLSWDPRVFLPLPLSCYHILETASLSYPEVSFWPWVINSLSFLHSSILAHLHSNKTINYLETDAPEPLISRCRDDGRKFPETVCITIERLLFLLKKNSIKSIEMRSYVVSTTSLAFPVFSHSNLPQSFCAGISVILWQRLCRTLYRTEECAKVVWTLILYLCCALGKPRNPSRNEQRPNYSVPKH